MATEEYGHPELLVDAAWVNAHKGDANVVIVDCEVDAAFARGHIPGAVLVPDNYEKDPDSGRVFLMNPAQFKTMCEGLGIGNDTLVIVYDHSRSLTAARLWWALNTYGHTNVKILNGGWRAWIANGGAVDFAQTKPSSVTFTPKRDDTLLATVDELKQACQVGDSVIWDVRSDGEWDGTNSRGNKRVGHVPGAVHLEWFNLVDSTTNKFKPAEEIRRLLSEHGITPDKNVYTY
ncbi:MAG: sulfurtransferase [SAR202 cluster bacterium]|nr:sulfurtransferase [SAR202 cluster bacterium]